MILKHTQGNSKVFNWLKLMRSENVGPRAFNQLVTLYKTPESAVENIEELASRGGLKRKIKVAENEKIHGEIEKTLDSAAIFLCSDEDDYPALLKSAEDHPPILIVKGSKLELLKSRKNVSIVGSRNSSLAGANFAKKIAEELAENEIVVTSGLARGIDTNAHIGSLKFATFAVIAGGIDNIYPQENKKLYEQIQESGLLITEQPFGSPALSKNFPQRNRIISGLSSAIIIVEAAKKSGTLITADYARKQKRKIYAVPGSPQDERCGGTNDLIKKGVAELFQETSEVIKCLSRAETNSLFEKAGDFLHQNISKVSESETGKYRAKLHNALSFTPTNIEDIISELGIPYHVLNILLLELEIAGKVVRTYGNKVQRVE